MQTESRPYTDHIRWWIDPEVMEFVDPLLVAITAPLRHLDLDIRFVRSAVLRSALLHLAEYPASPEDAAAIHRYMARWTTRDLALRTWDATVPEQERQQQVAGELGLRTADLQALAVRLLAEHHGLPVPEWRTVPEAPDGASK